MLLEQFRTVSIGCDVANSVSPSGKRASGALLGTRGAMSGPRLLKPGRLAQGARGDCALEQLYY
jgi:hypothetical protein